jgi:hypothetical protein
MTNVIYCPGMTNRLNSSSRQLNLQMICRLIYSCIAKAAQALCHKRQPEHGSCHISVDRTALVSSRRQQPQLIIRLGGAWVSFTISGLKSYLNCAWILHYAKASLLQLMAPVYWPSSSQKNSYKDTPLKQTFKQWSSDLNWQNEINTSLLNFFNENGRPFARFQSQIDC